MNKNTKITGIPDGCYNSLHRDGSASVVRKLQISRDAVEVTRTSPAFDSSSGILGLDIPQTAQRMADHFIDDLLNNSTFDTESTVLSSLPLRMPSMVNGLKKTHAFLVPVENPGYQCYAIAVLQLLQLLPQFWADLVTSLAVDGVMFEDVCEQRPTTFALLMYGSKLKNEYLKKMKELKEPSPILHTTWRMWQSHNGMMSEDKQEDATEFLIKVFAGIFNENQDDDTVLRSMNSHFFFKSRMRYQCQTCQTLKHTNPQVSNLINLSMHADGRDTSMQALVVKDQYSMNTLDSDDNLPTCTGCHNKGTVHNEWDELSSLPKFLFLCLKRYNEKRQKLNTIVECGGSLTIPIFVTEGEMIYYT